jgi:hypothetical protein
MGYIKASVKKLKSIDINFESVYIPEMIIEDFEYDETIKGNYNSKNANSRHGYTSLASFQD